MDKKIELLIKLNTLRDVELKLLEAKTEYFVIPDLVFEILKEVEESYKPNLGLGAEEEAQAIKTIENEIVYKPNEYGYLYNKPVSEMTEKELDVWYEMSNPD